MNRVEAGTMYKSIKNANKYYTFTVELFGTTLVSSPSNATATISLIKAELEPLLRGGLADEYVVKYWKKDNNGSVFILSLDKDDKVKVIEVSFFDYFKYTPWHYRDSYRRTFINRREYSFASILRKASSRKKSIQIIQLTLSWITIVVSSIFFAVTLMMLLTDSDILDAHSQFIDNFKYPLLGLSSLAFFLTLVPTITNTGHIIRSRGRVREALSASGTYAELRWKRMYKRKLQKRLIPFFLYNMFSVASTIAFMTLFTKSAYYLGVEEIPYVQEMLYIGMAAITLQSIRLMFTMQQTLEMIYWRKAVLRRHFSSERRLKPGAAPNDEPTSELEDFLIWYNDPNAKIPYKKTYTHYFSLDATAGYKEVKKEYKKLVSELDKKQTKKLFKQLRQTSSNAFDKSSKVFHSKKDLERYRR